MTAFAQRHQILECVRIGNAAGTADVADAVGCSHDTAYKRLRSLEDDGQVTSRKIGQARMWSVVDA